MEMTLRWFGTGFDSVTLEQIRQVPLVKGVITTLYDTYPGQVWEDSAIRKLKNTVEDAGLKISGIESVKSIESESTVLVGYFANAEEKNALMIVNCRNIYDPYASQKVTIRLNKKTAVNVYEHGELTRTENTDVLTVQPGSCDGIFITLS